MWQSYSMEDKTKKYVSIDIEKNDILFEQARADLKLILNKIDLIHDDISSFYNKYGSIIDQVGYSIKFAEFYQKLSVLIKPKLENASHLYDRLLLMSISIEQVLDMEAEKDDKEEN